ncbi:hypothetical protein F5X98DRAFT_380942 [Xylaria grammica]|nr:hypothetical protein F5X98DRAFT_380942 [Xylaria grammica]
MEPPDPPATARREEPPDCIPYKEKIPLPSAAATQAMSIIFALVVHIVLGLHTLAPTVPKLPNPRQKPISQDETNFQDNFQGLTVSPYDNHKAPNYEYLSS